MQNPGSLNNKVVLVLLPVWDPLIPPVGIASLKSFVKHDGFNVKTIDANLDKGLGNIKNTYFDSIMHWFPESKHWHVYNIGHEVLKNHMMAHWRYKNEKDYLELIKILVYNTFYHHITNDQANELKLIMDDFYQKLRNYILNLLEREKPDVLGLSVYGCTLPASLFTFKLAKEQNPEITTVMGGGIFSGELNIHSPNFQDFLKETPYIDKIIVGEGEALFLKLLKNQLPVSQRVFTLNDLNGETLDISSLDIPDFTDFDLSYYVQMPSYTSRSCPFQCKFCVETVYWGKYKKKSGSQIHKELLKLNEQYNSRLFLMCDSLLNPVIDDLADEISKTNTSLYWGGYLRGEKRVCDFQNTLRWRKAGFYRARVGVESGSQRVLDSMEKKIDIKTLKSSISNLALAGIKTTAMFVIGFPGETEEDFLKTLQLVEECQEDIYEADCNPFWYFYNGQVNSDQWIQMNKHKLLYPKKAKDMLLVQTWILDCEPYREVTYQRVNRFIEHCHRLKIPNPYTLYQTNEADERWKKLHWNAVPSLIDINGGQVEYDEINKVKNLSFAEQRVCDEGDWRF